MMNNNDNFYQKFSSDSTKRGSFKSSVFVPFISGVLGTTLVLGLAFGVPNIKNSLVSTSKEAVAVPDAVQTSNNGVVNHVSLNNYSDTAVYAASKVLPSIVGITVEYTVTSNFRQGYSQLATAEGSGIIISKDGYILTNNHVVDSESSNSYYDISEATSIKVILSDSKTEYDAKIVGKDSQTDLAVLKIDAKNLTAAEFADSDSVKVGEFCMAIGNPLDLGSTITCGVVSALNREVKDSEGKASYTCIQTDAAINSGNSGGALVNSQGKVIGVNTLKVASTGVEGIGFAIPINSTVDIIDELITYNKVRRPYIGVSGRDLDEKTATSHNLVEGVYVVSVEQYSAAELAGIKVGDVITAIDGKTVKTMEELNTIKNSHSIGDTITLKIYRDGKNKDISLKLKESN